MRVLSVNVSEPVIVSYQGKEVTTGIYKKPIQQPAVATTTHIEGDGQADLENHGGTDKAVYAFASEHYAYYQECTGIEALSYGAFGENLTTEGILESSTHVGDRFLIGTAILEVTQPRAPCFKLAMKMGTPDVVKKMVHSAKTGFYCRVVKEGEIAQGEINPDYVDECSPSIEEIHKLLYFDITNIAGLENVLANAALGEGLRNEFSGRLRRLIG